MSEVKPMTAAEAAEVMSRTFDAMTKGGWWSKVCVYCGGSCGGCCGG